MSIGLSDQIAPLGSFPIVEDVHEKGGLRVVADAAERNAISTARRKEKMPVVQADTGEWFQLKAAPWNGTDTDWEPAQAGSGSAAGTFVIRNGASPAGGIGPTWASILDKLVAAQGVRTVLIDDNGGSAISVPQDGAVNFDGQLDLFGVDRARGAVAFGGHAVRNVRTLRNLSMTLAGGQATAVMVGPIQGETVGYTGDLLVEDCSIVNSSTEAFFGPARVGSLPYVYAPARLIVRGKFALTGKLWEVAPGTTSEMYVGTGVTVPANCVYGAVGTTLNVYVEPGGDFNVQTTSFLGTMNVFVLGTSGVQYRKTHLTTRKEVNFDGLVVLTDDFLNNRINVDVVGDVFVLNPAGVAGGNVFTSWITLWPAVAATKGYRTIVVEGSGVSVPAGTYQCDGQVDVVGVYRNTTVPLTTSLAFSANAFLRNPRSVRNLSISSSTTSPIVSGSGTDATGYTGTITLENVDFVNSSAAFLIGFPSSGSSQAQMKVFLRGSLSLRTAARLMTFDAVGSTTREVHVGTGVVIPTGAITGGVGSAVTNVFQEPGGELGTQAGLLGTVNRTSYARSSVQESGTDVAARRHINFSGSAVSSVDDDPTNDRVNVVLSKDGGAAALAVERNGVAVSAQPSMNFVTGQSANSVAVTDDPSNNRVNVTIDPHVRVSGSASGSQVVQARELVFASTFSGENVRTTDIGGSAVGINVTPHVRYALNGTGIGVRATLNLIGSTISAVDQGSLTNRVDFTINPPTVQDEGTNVGTRPKINFTGSGVVVTDDSANNAVNVSIPGTGSIAVQDEGVLVTAAISNFNFTGGGVLATYNAGQNRVDVEITGASSIVVQDEGAVVDSSAVAINFIGPGVSSAFNVGQNRVDVTIPGEIQVARNGGLVGTKRTINFNGAGIGSVINAANDVTVTIPGLQVQEEGANAGSSRAILNFIGANVTAVDNPGQSRVDVTFGTGAGTIDFQDEGTGVATRGTVNFVGAGVTVADDSANGRVNVTISGGGSSTTIFQKEGTTIGTRGTANFAGAVDVDDNSGSSRVDVRVLSPSVTYIHHSGTSSGTVYANWTNVINDLMNNGQGGQKVLLLDDSVSGVPYVGGADFKGIVDVIGAPKGTDSRTSITTSFGFKWFAPASLRNLAISAIEDQGTPSSVIFFGLGATGSDQCVIENCHILNDFNLSSRPAVIEVNRDTNLRIRAPFSFASTNGAKLLKATASGKTLNLYVEEGVAIASNVIESVSGSTINVYVYPGASFSSTQTNLLGTLNVTSYSSTLAVQKDGSAVGSRATMNFKGPVTVTDTGTRIDVEVLEDYRDSGAAARSMALRAARSAPKPSLHVLISELAGAQAMTWSRTFASGASRSRLLWSQASGGSWELRAAEYPGSSSTSVRTFSERKDTLHASGEWVFAAGQSAIDATNGIVNRTYTSPGSGISTGPRAYVTTAIVDITGTPAEWAFVASHQDSAVYSFEVGSASGTMSTAVSTGLGSTPTAIVTDHKNRVWVACQGNFTIRRYEVGPGGTLVNGASIGTPAPLYCAVFDGRHVWFGGSNSLRRVDAETMVMTSVATTGPVTGLHFDGAFVWASHGNGIDRYDPETTERVWVASPGDVGSGTPMEVVGPPEPGLGLVFVSYDDGATGGVYALREKVVGRSVSVQSGGVAVGSQEFLNFTGATVTEDAANGRINVAVTGGGSAALDNGHALRAVRGHSAGAQKHQQTLNLSSFIGSTDEFGDISYFHESDSGTGADAYIVVSTDQSGTFTTYRLRYPSLSGATTLATTTSLVGFILQDVSEFVGYAATWLVSGDEVVRFDHVNSGSAVYTSPGSGFGGHAAKYAYPPLETGGVPRVYVTSPGDEEVYVATSGQSSGVLSSALTTPSSSGPLGICVDHLRNVWVAYPGTTQVVRCSVDTSTGALTVLDTVSTTYPILSNLVFDGRHVWGFDPSGGQLVRIDGSTLAVTTVSMGASGFSPRSKIYFDGATIVVPGWTFLRRINPETLERYIDQDASTSSSSMTRVVGTGREGGGILFAVNDTAALVFQPQDLEDKVEILVSGSPVAARRRLNFDGFTVTDEPSQDRVTVQAGAAAVSVQDEGSAAGVRAILNFIGPGVTAVDNPGQSRVDVTVSPTLVIRDEGTVVGTRPSVNFIGAAITAVDNPGQNRVDVTVNATGYATVQDEGSALAQRAAVNFIGPGVTAVDNAPNGRTNVTIPGTSVQDEGSALTYAPTVNFTGGGVTATYDSGNNRINVNVPTSAGSAVDFYDEGALVASRAAVDFVGSGVVVTDDVPNSRVVVTINGGSGSGLSGDTGGFLRQARGSSIAPRIAPNWGVFGGSTAGSGWAMAQHCGTIWMAGSHPSYAAVLLAVVDSQDQAVSVINEIHPSVQTVTDLVMYSHGTETFGAVVHAAGVSFKGSPVTSSSGYLYPFNGTGFTTQALGAGGRAVSVDEAGFGTRIWVTRPGNNDLAWYLGNDPENTQGTVDPGLGTPIVAMAYSPYHGMFLVTATEIYVASVTGASLGTPTLVRSLAGVTEVKFDGERILAAKAGSVRALDPVTGNDVWIRNDANVTSKSRIGLSSHGLFTLTGTYPDGGVSIRDTAGREVSRSFRSSSGYASPVTTGAVLHDEGYVAQAVEHLTSVAPYDQDDGQKFDNELIGGMGKTVRQYFGTVESISGAPAIGPNYVPTVPANIRVRRISARITVLNSLAGGVAFDVNFRSYGSPIGTLPFTETTPGVFYLEQEVSYEMFGGGQSITIDVVKQGGGSQSVDWEVAWAASWETVESLGSTSNVTTLPHVVSGTFVATEECFVNGFSLDLVVNTALNAGDLIKVDIRKNGSSMASATETEAAGPLTFSTATVLGIDAVAGDVFSLEIENVTNPGSAVDYTLVSELIFWSAGSISFRAGSPALWGGSTNPSPINSIEFHYLPVFTTTDDDLVLRLYKNGTLHNSHAFVQGALETEVNETYSPSPSLSLDNGDTFYFEVATTDEPETWRFSWDSRYLPSVPGYALRSELHAVYPTYTAFAVLSHAKPLAFHKSTLVADRIALPNELETGFLKRTSSGRVSVSPAMWPVAYVTTNSTFTSCHRAFVDSTGTGGLTITLPPSGQMLPGEQFLVADRGGLSVNTNWITVDAGASNIGGSSTYVINRPYESLLLEWNGSSWSKVREAGVVVQDDSGDLNGGAPAPRVYFTGAGVTTTWDNGNKVATVTIPGGGGSGTVGTPSRMPAPAAALLYRFDGATAGSVVPNFGTGGSVADATISLGLATTAVRNAIGVQFQRAMKLSDAGDARVFTAHSGITWPNSTMTVWCSFVPTGRLAATSRVFFKQTAPATWSSPFTQMSVEWNASGLQFRMVTTGGTATITVPPLQSDFPLNEPMTVGMTLSGGVVTAYVNGQSVGTSSPGGDFDPGTGPLVFGNYDDGASGAQERIGGLYHEFGVDSSVARNQAWFEEQYHRFLGNTSSGATEVLSEGAAVATRSRINFTGPGVTVTDDVPNGRVNVDITGGGGGGPTAGTGEAGIPIVASSEGDAQVLGRAHIFWTDNFASTARYASITADVDGGGTLHVQIEGDGGFPVSLTNSTMTAGPVSIVPLDAGAQSYGGAGVFLVKAWLTGGGSATVYSVRLTGNPPTTPIVSYPMVVSDGQGSSRAGDARSMVVIDNTDLSSLYTIPDSAEHVLVETSTGPFAFGMQLPLDPPDGWTVTVTDADYQAATNSFGIITQSGNTFSTGNGSFTVAQDGGSVTLRFRGGTYYAIGAVNFSW